MAETVSEVSPELHIGLQLFLKSLSFLICAMVTVIIISL